MWIYRIDDSVHGLLPVSLLPQRVGSVWQNALPWVFSTLFAELVVAFHLANTCTFAVFIWVIVLAMIFLFWRQVARWPGVYVVTEGTEVRDVGRCAHCIDGVERDLFCCDVAKSRWLCWDKVRGKDVRMMIWIHIHGCHSSVCSDFFEVCEQSHRYGLLWWKRLHRCSAVCSVRTINNYLTLGSTFRTRKCSNMKAHYWIIKVRGTIHYHCPTCNSWYMSFRLQHLQHHVQHQVFNSKPAN